jgi:hypothetical protein
MEPGAVIAQTAVDGTTAQTQTAVIGTTAQTASFDVHNMPNT